MKEDIYSNPEANQVKLEGAVDRQQIGTPLIKIEYRKNVGTLSHSEGASFPNYTVTPKDAEDILQRNNIFKAVFIGMFRLRPNLISFLDYFTRIGHKSIAQYLPVDDYKTVFARELEDIIYDFTFSLTSKSDTARYFSKLCAQMVDFDEPYRTRVVDIASETSKEKLLKHPNREIKRLINILAKREVVLGEVVTNKFRMISKLVRLMLWIPKYRRAFKHAIRMSDWDNLQYDDIHRYWACLRRDYDYMGLSCDERLKLLEDNGLSIPVQRIYKI